MRRKEEEEAAPTVAGYRWRLSFRGSDAEIGNGLGRLAASGLSAACLLRFFFSVLRSALAQSLQRPLPRRISLGFGVRSSSIKLGYFRLFRCLFVGPAGTYWDAYPSELEAVLTTHF